MRANGTGKRTRCRRIILVVLLMYTGHGQTRVWVPEPLLMSFCNLDDQPECNLYVLT